MSERHTTAQERELYVMDALAAEGRAHLEEHVLGCPSCHAALMEEARVEMTLHELCSPPADEVTASAAAPRPLIALDPRPESAWRGRPVRLAFFAMSAAAALVLLLRPDPNATRQRGPVGSERSLTDNAGMESELTLEQQPAEDEALVCGQLIRSGICAWGDTTTSGGVGPAALHNVSFEPAVSVGEDEITCALPPAAACVESRGTCGP